MVLNYCMLIDFDLPQCFGCRSLLILGQSSWRMDVHNVSLYLFPQHSAEKRLLEVSVCIAESLRVHDA